MCTLFRPPSAAAAAALTYFFLFKEAASFLPSFLPMPGRTGI
jgi:hypothetical protein